MPCCFLCLAAPWVQPLFCRVPPLSLSLSQYLWGAPFLSHLHFPSCPWQQSLRTSQAGWKPSGCPPPPLGGGEKREVTLYLCRYRTRHQSHPPHCKTDTWAPGRTWRRPWPTPCGSRSRPAPRRTPGSNRSRPALSSCSAGCFCTRRCRSARGSPPHTWCSRPPPGAQGPGAWPAAGGSSCSPKALACLPAGGVVFAGGKQLSKVVAEPLPTRLWVLYTGLPACFPVINFLNPAAALSSCQALLF